VRGGGEVSWRTGSDERFDPVAEIAAALKRQTREKREFLIVESDP
jgi:hypothetical protein